MPRVYPDLGLQTERALGALIVHECTNDAELPASGNIDGDTAILGSPEDNPALVLADGEWTLAEDPRPQEEIL